jgi:oligopeptide transport system permease protein
LVNKVGSALITLLVIITLTFFLMHAIPGGPFDSAKQLPESIMQNLNARYNLDKPLWSQYLAYLTNLVQGDLGVSIKYEEKTVNDIIKEGFPISALIGGMAMAAAVISGVVLGVAAALYRNRLVDYFVTIFATAGSSIPSFVWAGLLMYFLAIKFRWLPPAFWEGPESAVLPVLALVWLPAATIARLVRTSMIEVLSKDYIKTARAKGLGMQAVVARHALPNAILPVLTYLGPAVALILTGSFVVESIFAIPGLGKWFVTSVANRDYTIIMGLTVFYSALLILMNMLVDIAYTLLDPRIRIGHAKER